MKQIKYSKYQLDLFDEVKNTNNNIIVQAVSGSGKTSSLIKCVDYLPKTTSILFLAFNKSIVEELKHRLPNNVNVRTLHSIGLQLIKNNTGINKQINLNKFNEIYDEIVSSTKKYKQFFNQEYNKRNFKYFIQKLSNLVKSNLIDFNSEEEIVELMNFYDINSSKYSLSLIKGAVKKICQLSLDYEKYWIDFSDMTWMPIMLDFKSSYNYILIDEVQDLDKSKMKLIKNLSNKNTRVLMFGDKNQCQPLGTKITIQHLINEKPILKNIEDIKIGDCVVTYESKNNFCFRTYKSSKYNMYKNSKKVKNISKNIYNGELVVVKSNNKTTKYTPNHKCIARLSEIFNNKVYTLYLMRKNNAFRIGIVTAYTKSMTSGMGVRHRLRSEKCDEVWILDIYDKKEEALRKEFYYSHKYNIPMFIFQQHHNNTYPQDFIDNCIEEFYNNENTLNRAIELLELFNRNINYPLFTKEHKYTHFSRKHSFELYACNLIPKYMELNHYNTKNIILNRKGCPKIKKDYYEIDTITYEKYNNYVYSLEIETDENYVADGILTHNSILGFSGANTNSMNDIKKMFNAKELPLSICYRCPTSHIENVKHLVPEIKAFEENKEGTIDVIPEVNIQNYVKDGNDAIICRTNSPLIKICLLLISNNIKAFVKGNDLKDKIVFEVKDAIRKNNVKLSELRTYFNNLTGKLGNEIEQLKQEQIIQVDNAIKFEEKEWIKRQFYFKKKNTIFKQDLAYTILYFLRNELLSGTKDLFDLIKKTFTEDKNAVCCSTIHKSKGLEFENVYLLYPHLLPHPQLTGNTEWQQQQEKNVEYVAKTRAKSKLYEVLKVDDK